MAPAGTCCLRAGPTLGGGVFGGCQAQRFRLLVVTTAMLHALYFLLSLLLLAIPAPTHAWSRPLWYQVGLDLQPWGCQPNSLDSCRSSLGCPGSWMGLGGNRIYPVAGVTITTTMMLVISRGMLQRWRSQGTKDKVSTVLLHSSFLQSHLSYLLWAQMHNPTLFSIAATCCAPFPSLHSYLLE